MRCNEHRIVNRGTLKTHPKQKVVLSLALLLLCTLPGSCEEKVILATELIPQGLMADEEDGACEDIEVGGRGIQVVRIPISFPLITKEKRGFDLRLTVPISFGFHELTVDTVQEGRIRENLSTVTILPGLEWELALPKRGAIKPFVETGIGSDLGSSQNAWIFSVGSRLLRPVGKETSNLRLGARVQYSGSSVDSDAQSDGLLIGEVGIERMFGLGRTIRGHQANFGLYTLAHYNFTNFRFKELDGELTALQGIALELGFSFGTESDLILLGMRLPRVGLSYRSSGDFQSWRINFGFPF